MNLKNACLSAALLILEALIAAALASAIDFVYLDNHWRIPLAVAVPLGVQAVVRGGKE